MFSTISKSNSFSNASQVFESLRCELASEIEEEFDCDVIRLLDTFSRAIAFGGQSGVKIASISAARAHLLAT